MMIYSKTYPCMGCSKRTLGCHSHCKDYKEAKASDDEIKEIKKREANVENFVINSIVKKTNGSKKIYIQSKLIKN